MSRSGDRLPMFPILQLQQPICAHSAASDWLASKPETDVMSNHPPHILPHATFNGLSTRLIPLAELWPPVCCAKLTFLLHQIRCLCVTSPLCAPCSLFSIEMFYYYPERPPSSASVYFWILSSPCLDDDLDPSHSKFQHPSHWIHLCLSFLFFFKPMKPYRNTSVQQGLLIWGQAFICLPNSNIVSKNCGISVVLVGVLPACRGAAWEKVAVTGRSI